MRQVLDQVRVLVAVYQQRSAFVFDLDHSVPCFPAFLETCWPALIVHGEPENATAFRPGIQLSASRMESERPDMTVYLR